MMLLDDPRLLPWHEEKLTGVTLVHQPWRVIEGNDHDHCAFCWAKFAEASDCLHEGYSTENRYYWVCEECFHDFKERFGWRVKPCISAP